MILVTVGTTPFNALIKVADQNLPREWNVHLQIADGTYVPKYFDWFRFSENIADYYLQSDFVICHAGAGTVFRLLELRKKLIVLPNLARSDPHQKELANFLNTNHYAIVCNDPIEIAEAAKLVPTFDFQLFSKPCFSGGPLLLERIQNLYRN